MFFITQRPATAGATVQLQTHRWLVEHGFSTPSVIPLSGGRGKCAAGLQLDYLVDDTPQNCVDVLSDSSTRAILLVNGDDPLAESSARRLGIGTARTVHEVLDLLVQATAARANPSLFEKLRKLVGWKVARLLHAEETRQLDRERAVLQFRRTRARACCAHRCRRRRDRCPAGTPSGAAR